MSKQKDLYNKFCEIMAGSEHISSKFVKVQLLIANSVFDMNPVGNPRNLTVDPDDYRKSQLYIEYIQSMEP